MTATVDQEDAALQAREEYARIQAEIARGKAELEALRGQKAQALNGKALSVAEEAKQKALKDLGKKRHAYLKAQVKWTESGKQGMPPHYLSQLTNHFDASAAPVNPDGSSVVPEGMCAVWVSCYDQQGRDASDPQEVRRRKSEGYQVAAFEDGREVRDGGLGVLMYATPEAAAVWTERRMKPGTINPNDYFAADFEKYVEQENNASSGERVMNVTRAKEHKTKHLLEVVEDPSEADADEMYS
jgi:hypothetical protein